MSSSTIVTRSTSPMFYQNLSLLNMKKLFFYFLRIQFLKIIFFLSQYIFLLDIKHFKMLKNIKNKFYSNSCSIHSFPILLFSQIITIPCFLILIPKIIFCVYYKYEYHRKSFYIHSSRLNTC